MTTLLNILLLVAVALSITGVVNRTRARLAGRRGPRFTQHLHNTAPVSYTHLMPTRSA